MNFKKYMLTVPFMMAFSLSAFAADNCTLDDIQSMGQSCNPVADCIKAAQELDTSNLKTQQPADNYPLLNNDDSQDIPTLSIAAINSCVREKITKAISNTFSTETKNPKSAYTPPTK